MPNSFFLQHFPLKCMLWNFYPCRDTMYKTFCIKPFNNFLTMKIFRGQLIWLFLSHSNFCAHSNPVGILGLFISHSFFVSVHELPSTVSHNPSIFIWPRPTYFQALGSKFPLPGSFSLLSPISLPSYIWAHEHFPCVQYTAL